MATILVAGASTGIGRATALLLDRRGHTVCAGARSEADGGGLRPAASDRLRPIMLDIGTLVRLPDHLRGRMATSL